jgi:hypothetical protein
MPAPFGLKVLTWPRLGTGIRLLCACAWAFSVAAVALPSWAQSARAVHLSWVRAPEALECGDAGQVQADVVRRLGKSPFSEPSKIFIEATVSRPDSAFVAQLEMRDQVGASLGSRRVTSEAPSCASLVAAAGLAIALMIDPDAALAPPSTPAPSPPPAPPVPAKTSAVASREPAPRAPQLTFAVAALVAARVLPQAAWGVRLGADQKLVARVHAELSLSFLPQVRQELHGVDVGFGLTYGSLGICYEPLAAARVTLAACGFGQIGAMSVNAYEPARSRAGQLLWSTAGVGLRAGWVLAEPLLLRAGVEGTLPIQRREYAVARATEPALVVFRDPAFAATLHLGLATRF